MSNRKRAHIEIMRVQTLQILRTKTQLQDNEINILADAIITDIQQQFSGERVYFPAPRYDRQQVLDDFNGRNGTEVCRKHRISRSTFFNIIGSRLRKK